MTIPDPRRPYDDSTAWYHTPHMPPGHPGYGYGRPPYPPRRSRRGWWAAAAAAAIAVIALAAVVVWQHTKPDVLLPVADSQLDGLLLTSAQAAEAVGTPLLTAEPILKEADAAAIVDSDCGAISLIYDQSSYGDSGASGLRWQSMDDFPGESWRIKQAVVALPDATAASGVVATAEAEWERCANREINTRQIDFDDPSSALWTVGPVSDTDEILTASLKQKGQNWTCERGLAARSNVVIDLTLCGDRVTPSAVPSFVDAISAKIPRQR